MNKYCIAKPYSHEGEGRIEVVKYHDEIVEGELAVLEGLIDHFKSMDHWPACEGAYPIKIHRLDEWSDKITKQRDTMAPTYGDKNDPLGPATSDEAKEAFAKMSAYKPTFGDKNDPLI